MGVGVFFSFGVSDTMGEGQRGVEALELGGLAASGKRRVGGQGVVGLCLGLALGSISRITGPLRL